MSKKQRSGPLPDSEKVTLHTSGTKTVLHVTKTKGLELRRPRHPKPPPTPQKNRLTQNDSKNVIWGKVPGLHKFGEEGGAVPEMNCSPGMNQK
eukprot:943513-Amphidinium_carterae.1